MIAVKTARSHHRCSHNSVSVLCSSDEVAATKSGQKACMTAALDQISHWTSQIALSFLRTLHNRIAGRALPTRAHTQVDKTKQG
jgi:hypothetical protein